MEHPFPSSVLMIRPASFSYDEETAKSNPFQTDVDLTPAQLQNEVLEEFDAMVERLKKLGLLVYQVEDRPEPPKPSAVFPNNWISFHEDGTVVLYPMQSKGRSLERRPELADWLEKESPFRVRRTIDLSDQEKEGKALEGTGSIVFDREDRVAYACRSPRTDIPLFEHLCERLGYRPISFRAVDPEGVPIYHTNVMLAIGNGFAILCEEAIEEPMERSMVKMQLRDSGKEVISIDPPQMKAFAGNAFQVYMPEKGPFLLLSRRACDALKEEQLRRIESHSAVECLSVDRIEEVGGGGVRCMLAGILLPEKGPDKE